MAGLQSYVDGLATTHAREQHARQRQEQRKLQEDQDREGRERRSADERPGSPRAGVVYAVGSKVLHDILGEAIVRKLARSEDPEGKINIEWSRPGKRKRDPPTLQNRWVLSSSMRKLWSSPRGTQPTTTTQTATSQAAETQHGLFGAMPDLAAHERERTAHKKLPEGPRGRHHEPRQTKESKVPIVQRLREFPDQCLMCSAGKLFCRPCKEIIPNIKSSIEDHVRRQKHKGNVAKYQETHGDNAEIKELLSDHFKNHPDESGASISDEVHVFRYRVVETFMASGTPLERIDKHRTLLERTGMALTAVPHLRTAYIPRV